LDALTFLKTTKNKLILFQNFELDEDPKKIDSSINTNVSLHNNEKKLEKKKVEVIKPKYSDQKEYDQSKKFDRNHHSKKVRISDKTSKVEFDTTESPSSINEKHKKVKNPQGILKKYDIKKRRYSSVKKVHRI